MKTISLEIFLRRASVYETWLTPLSQTLRVTAWLSSGSLLLSLLLIWFAPELARLQLSPLILICPQQAVEALAGLAYYRHQLLVFSTGLLLAWFAAFLFSGCFRSGPIVWHQLTFIISAVGALHGIILSLALAALLLNLLLWILMLIIVIGLLFAILAWLINRH